MSDKVRLKSSGGVSPAGTTTDVALDDLDPADKKVICSAICHCDKAASAPSGRALKQVCVSKRLRALDAMLHHRSPYKAEQPYDMTKQPPAPVMNKSVDTKPHSFLPAWIRWIWPKDPAHPTYRRGSGMTAQPDVVIVKRPNDPPTQDNIKQIVEIKFPGDRWGNEQQMIYDQIAGEEGKVIELSPEECDCAALEREMQESLEKTEDAAGAAAAAAALLWLLTRGRAGRPPFVSPTPAPVH